MSLVLHRHQQNSTTKQHDPLPIRIPFFFFFFQLRRGLHSASLHLTQHTRLRHIRHVDEDVVCRVTVQRCAEALLIEMVADEADGATEDEETVESADL